MMDDEDDYVYHILLSDSDSEDNDDFIIVCAGLTEEFEREKRNFYVQDRVEWDKHIKELLDEGEDVFLRVYRMSYNAFCILCDQICDDIAINEEQSRKRTGKEPITPEIMLHCLLRWLAGGSVHDIRMNVGISKPSFYRIVYRCIQAINKNANLSYQFPTTGEEIEAAAAAF